VTHSSRSRRRRPPPKPPGKPRAEAPPRSGRPRKPPAAWWWVPAALAALHLALALLAFQPAPHPGGDNAVYLSLARSLLSGGGYRDAFDPALPAHTQFPPGYPVMLAAALFAGLKPWAGIKLLTLLSSAAAVALAWAWVRRRAGARMALAVAGLVAVSPGVVTLSHWELSDVPFWALTMAALLAWERLGRGRTRRLLLAAAATVAAYLTRAAGLPLLLAGALWLVYRRRWRQLAIYLAVALPPALLWWLWARAQAGYAGIFAAANPYAPDAGTVGAGGLASRVAENLELYLGRFVPVLLWGASSPLLVALGIMAVALAAAGWARRLERAGVAELFFPFYAAMLLVWTPQWAGERLLLPLLVPLLAYAAEALVWLAPKLRLRPRVAGAVAAGLAVLVGLPQLVGAVRAGAGCTQQYLGGDRYACLSAEWHDFFETAARARAGLPDGAVVLSRKPAFFYAASGLRGRALPLDRDPAVFFRTADEAGAGYVVLDYLDEVAEQYLVPVLMRRPQAFCIVEALGPSRAALLGIRPGASSMPDLRGDPGGAQMDVGFQPCGLELRRRPGTVPPVPPVGE
jgi:Dolichyl-phosphate-mannose-protein mannosyltransferase